MRRIRNSLVHLALTFTNGVAADVSQNFYIPFQVDEIRVIACGVACDTDDAIIALPYQDFVLTSNVFGPGGTIVDVIRGMHTTENNGGTGISERPQEPYRRDSLCYTYPPSSRQTISGTYYFSLRCVDGTDIIRTTFTKPVICSVILDFVQYEAFQPITV